MTRTRPYASIIEELAETEHRAVDLRAEAALALHRAVLDGRGSEPERTVWRPTPPPSAVTPSTYDELDEALCGLFETSRQWPASTTDPGSGLTLEPLPGSPDLRLRMAFDPAARLDPNDDPTHTVNSGGANWVNGYYALPGDGHSDGVRLSYLWRTPSDFGRSMKLPGLSAVTGDQRAPGGGHVGPRQFNVRPAVSDWDSDGVDVRVGPYAYWPAPAAPVVMTSAGGSRRLWVRETANYRLDWYGPPGQSIEPDRWYQVQLTVERPIGSGWRIELAVGTEATTYHYVPSDVDPTFATHVAFTLMYGGHTADYGPDSPTETIIDGLRLEWL